MLPRQKLEGLKRRFSELEQLLCDPAVFGDPKKLNTLNRERVELSPVVEAFQNYQNLERSIAEDKEALSDPELGPLAREELPGLEANLLDLEARLRLLLLPKDPNDDKNTLLEIRAGTGGEEAALFAGDLSAVRTLRRAARLARRNHEPDDASRAV